MGKSGVASLFLDVCIVIVSDRIALHTSILSCYLKCLLRLPLSLWTCVGQSLLCPDRHFGPYEHLFVEGMSRTGVWRSRIVSGGLGRAKVQLSTILLDREYVSRR